MAEVHRTTCSVEGCDKKHHGKSFCKYHHRRWAMHGDPLYLSKDRTPRGELMKFIRETVANPPKECVVWPYGHSMGYGKVMFEKRVQQAHRVALILHSGKNPRKLHAAHGECHNRLCINPLHYSWKTASENSKDMVRDNTRLQGEQLHSAKLTVHQVRAIRNDPRRRKIIAKEYGIAWKYVTEIQAGRS